MLIYDADGVLQSVNPALCTLPSYCVEELLGQNIELILPHYPQDEDHREFHRQVQRLGRWDGELFGRHKRGDLLALWWTLSYSGTLDEVIAGYYVGSVTDRRRCVSSKNMYCSCPRPILSPSSIAFWWEERLGLDIRQADHRAEGGLAAGAVALFPSAQRAVWLCHR